jgi:hypothetical protein
MRETEIFDFKKVGGCSMLSIVLEHLQSELNCGGHEEPVLPKKSILRLGWKRMMTDCFEVVE